MGDALAVHNVEFRLPEGWRHFIFHDLGPGPVAHHLAAVFQRLNPADVDADGGVELQRPAAGGDLRVAVHNAHLLAKLVDENNDCVGLAHRAGELPEGLTHQSGVKAHIAVAHSPSISARGTSAATESTTITSMAPDAPMPR